MTKKRQYLHDALQNALGPAVRFDTAHRAVYGSDASNYRQVPIGVVVPRSMDDFLKGAASVTKIGCRCSSVAPARR
jgi:hypothetical protein